jgi:curved DNA-binding protein CbpA
MSTTALDPYATLGIPPGSSRAEAGRAHRRLAKQFHPDTNPGPEAAGRMRRVNEAWRVLSDPARRARYDATRAGPSSGASQHWSASSYGPPADTATWTVWPDERQRAATRMRRPVRPEPLEPSFGDRPVVLVAVWFVLGLLYFIGAWLGSLSP